MSFDSIPSIPGGRPAVTLTLSNLTAPKENTYFAWVLVISILVWIGLVFSLVGLFYGVILAVGLWFGNGLLTARLRTESVRVGPDQLPELHATFVEVCDRLGVKKRPALYVLQADGALNAFATRFSGRDFVVIYAEFLTALGTTSPEVKFVLGHELGHIQSRHIAKQIFLAPGMFFPLVGPAYRRAWETSCDRHGAFAAQDVDGAVRAMLMLGGGAGNVGRLSAAAYVEQHQEERGFFVSLHELTSTYPTLSRRVVDLLALGGERPAAKPKRDALAYFVAMMMPGGNLAGGGAAGLMMMMVVIGLMAAMAIPAFAKVRENAQGAACANNQRMLAAALDQYQLEQGKAVESWDDVVGEGGVLKSMPVCPSSGEYSAEPGEGGYVTSCSVEAHNRLAGGASH